MKKKRLSELIDEDYHIPKQEKIFDIKDLYNLFDSYCKKKIDENTFENEFYVHYTKNRNEIYLTDKERDILNELSEEIHRFSPYIKDHDIDPKAFLTTNEVRQKILSTKKKLDAL